jgi:hypothetical protein
MEASGFAIDADRMRSLRQEADAMVAALLFEIRSSFNNEKLNAPTRSMVRSVYPLPYLVTTDL